MSKGVSRRRVIQATVALSGALAGGWAHRAAAEDEIAEKDKITHKVAQYQQQPKGQQRCEICLQFEPPNRCKIVQAPITPNGWCQFFAARENAH